MTPAAALVLGVAAAYVCGHEVVSTRGGAGMSEPTAEGGHLSSELSSDLSYDEVHAAHGEQPPRHVRSETGAPDEPPAELSGDYSYDLAHDVPRS